MASHVDQDHSRHGGGGNLPYWMWEGEQWMVERAPCHWSQVPLRWMTIMQTTMEFPFPFPASTPWILYSVYGLIPSTAGPFRKANLLAVYCSHEREIRQVLITRPQRLYYICSATRLEHTVTYRCRDSQCLSGAWHRFNHYHLWNKRLCNLIKQYQVSFI